MAFVFSIVIFFIDHYCGGGGEGGAIYDKHAYFSSQFSSPEPIAHWWAYRIGRPSSVRRPHSLNIFSSETTRPISQISYGASLGWGNKSLFKRYWSHDQDGRHAHILVKNLKNLLQNQRPMILKLGMQHRVLEYYQMITLGWPWPILRQGQIWSRMLLYGKR